MIGVTAAVAAGAITWTFLEYVIHRWGGHDRRFKRTPFGVEHVRHHIEGDYFSPSWKKVVIATLVGFVVLLLASAVAGRGIGAGYVGGLLACYAGYELLHRREHTHPGVGPYGRWARRHHFHHHFSDGRKNHGVTSPLWDLVFGTYETPTTIRVPRKLTMAWLVDPATGEVRGEHAGTYQLR
jgi:sterol desaturase/sphingolipid hydroxylase (fatty acid hydroxylase superfamily)